MELKRFDLSSHQNELKTGETTKALVFVHGIFSSPETFEPFRKLLHEENRCVDRQLSALRYDWDKPIAENGQLFSTILQNHFKQEDNVALVCHSMGGLIARIAVLVRSLPFVKTIFLIGTPNQGTFLNAQLGLLLQLTRAATGKLTAFSHRGRGLYDLTQVPNELRKFSESIANVNHIDYVSLPGLFFNRNRGDFMDMFELLKKDKLIGGLTLVSTVVGYWWNSLRAHLHTPNDGVVEAESNNLAVLGAGRWSEKIDDIRGFTSSPTYAHIEHKAFENLSHCNIHVDEATVRMVADILEAGSLAIWLKQLGSLSGRGIINLEPESATIRTHGGISI